MKIISILQVVYGPGKWYHSEGPYNEYRRQYECVLFYIDGLYRDKVTFEIEYEMSNASFRYKDCSELYLCMYSEDTVNYLESFKAQILIPNKDMPESDNYYAHTYGTNSNEFPFTESSVLNPGYRTFTFNLDESDLKFSPHNEYIEFALVSYGDDYNIFTEYAPENDYSNDYVLQELKDEHEEYVNTYKEYSHKKFIILLVCIGGSIFVLLIAIGKENNVKSKFTFYKPTIQADYFRDIPSDLDPTFASELVFCKNKKPKDKGDGYASIMLSLVRKGYIELVKINSQEDWKRNNVQIIVKYNQKMKKMLESTTNLYNSSVQHLVREEAKRNNTILIKDNNSSLVEQSLHESLNKQIKAEQDIIAIAKEKLKSLEEQIQSYKKELDKYEPLTPSEEYYFNFINYHAGSSGKISVSSFQSKISTFYVTTDAFVKNVENSITKIGVGQKYFQKTNYKEPRNELQKTAKTFKKLGLIFLIIFNFISYFSRLDLVFGGYFILGGAFLIGYKHLNKVSKKYVLLTQFGEDEYIKWRGLYNFLNSETLMNERTFIELPIWEKYLIYATAFGISEKVIKALKIRCPEVNMSPILSNSYYHSVNFRSSTRSFSSSTNRATSTYRSGGYSGGWRIRWRRPWRRWGPEAVTNT